MRRTTVKVGAGNRPPVPSIGSPAASLHYKVGDVIAFAGSATDPEDGDLAAAALAGRSTSSTARSACATRIRSRAASGAGGAFVVPDHGDESQFELVLTATDSGGLYASTNADPRSLRRSS